MPSHVMRGSRFDKLLLVDISHREIQIKAKKH